MVLITSKLVALVVAAVVAVVGRVGLEPQEQELAVKAQTDQMVVVLRQALVVVAAALQVLA